jgi:hypothetical protein
LPVARDVVSVFVHDPQLAGADEFDALARFDLGPFCQRKLLVLQQGFAEGDQRRRLGHSINMGQLPPELALDQLDRRRRGRCPGREQPDARRRPRPDVVRRVRDADEHRRSGAKHRDLLVLNELEDQPRFHLP